MSCYPHKLNVTPLEDGKTWLLNSKFCYQSDAHRKTICAESGFEFDFASIPRLFWRVLGSPATGRHRYGAVIHDWLYATNETTRKEADQIFCEAMICSGVNALKAWLIYRAVRAFGSRAWNK